MIVPAMALSLSLFAQVPAQAADLSIREGVNSSKSADQADCLFGTGDGIFKTITNVMLFVIGAVSVIMLIIGGIRYTVSNGDSTAVQNAKNTIMYAIIGIIVALIAFAVVNFVVTSFAANN